MNPQSSNGWPPPSGYGGPLSNENHMPGQQRPLGNLGASLPMQQGQPQLNGPPLVPQPGPFYSDPTNTHPSSLMQVSPMQPNRGQPPFQQQLSPPGSQHQATALGYSLPALDSAMQQQQPPQVALEQDREHAREREAEMERRQQQETIAQRDYEREIELREQQQREQHHSPHENHTGSIPIQQPVASRIPATLHGPNGILNHQHVGTNGVQVNPSAPLGAPSGPGNVFVNNMQPGREASPHQFIQQGPQLIPAPQLLNPGGLEAAQQVPAALSQGAQQPILNDALSYLDQVKVRFVDQPDVYNRFLDIMKDFKSQAIDTPGVIDRVSSLFAGHPELIQGFNTFLPPGYRIECGTQDDPNAIRVTTPMGTTVSQMPSAPSRFMGPGAAPGLENGMSVARQGPYAETSANGDWPLPHQEGIEAGENPFLPNGRAGVHPQYNGQRVGTLDGTTVYDREEQIAAAEAAHRQEQRGVSNLSHVASAIATNGATNHLPMAEVSPNGGQVTGLSQGGLAMNSSGSILGSGNQMGLEKRGPVEFNHAIGYVNKIKNRFASQPDIYKSFLEILQTYQRESKPIQDVYAQVTQLFSTAPDLLEDFKQFLPESAAQAKAQAAAAARQATEDAAMLSNVRGDAAYLAGVTTNQAHTPRPEMKMPPVGNFAPPPSVGKENKKRRGGAGSQLTGGAAAPDTAPGTSSQNIKGSGMRGSNSNKLAHKKLRSYRCTAEQELRHYLASGFILSIAAMRLRKDASSPEPTLPSIDFSAVRSTANMPPPPKRARIEQAKQPGSELPPVSPTLVPSLPRPLPPTDSSAGNSDEFAFFDRVRKHLSNKQTYNEFLKIINLYNQEMVDKNLLVHKAFSFLGNNIELMTWFRDYIRYDGRDEILENKPRTASTKVVLSNCRGLGPSYRLVPKAAKLEMKCSGRDEMCYSVLNDDWSSFPTWASEDSGFIAHRKNTFEDALHRCEEERHDYDINIEACLRTIQLMEPIVAQIKTMSAADQDTYKLPPGIGGMSETIYERVIKKIYGRETGGRVIQDMFEVPAAVLPMLSWRLNQKVEEWKASMREWDKVWREQTHKQFWKSLDHQGVRVTNASIRQFQPKSLQTEIQIKYEEQRRARAISSTIVPRYQLSYVFNDVEVIYDTCHLLLTCIYAGAVGTSGDYSRLHNFFNTFIPIFFDLDRESFQRSMSDVDDQSPPNEEAEDEHAEEPGPGRGRRAANGRKGTLLRGVLDRKLGHRDRDDSAMRGSKETTPDVVLMDEETATPSDQAARPDPGEHRWMEHPHGILNHDEPFPRDTFALYASSNIYCFLRMFQLLYERLANIKSAEDDVHKDVHRSNIPKAADALGIQDKKPAEYFSDISPTASYYRQVLAMCENVARGAEASPLEETLRRFYLQKGWQLYNFDKITSATLRFALNILVSDNKDKSLDIVNLFYKDRKQDETTHDAELMYRKQVEKLSKDGDIYRISYSRNTREAYIQIFKKDDRTFEIDEMAALDRWKYYVSSYTMRDQTEGVPQDKTWLPLLRRNLPPVLDTLEEYNCMYSNPQHNQDGLLMKIHAGSYKLQYEKNSADWFVHDDVVRRMGLSGMQDMKKERKRKFVEKFVTNPKWMAETSKEEVQKKVEETRLWMEGGVEMDKEEALPQNDRASDEKTEQDEVMTGV